MRKAFLLGCFYLVVFVSFWCQRSVKYNSVMICFHLFRSCMFCLDNFVFEIGWSVSCRQTEFSFAPHDGTIPEQKGILEFSRVFYILFHIIRSNRLGDDFLTLQVRWKTTGIASHPWLIGITNSCGKWDIFSVCIYMSLSYVIKIWIYIRSKQPKSQRRRKSNVGKPEFYNVKCSHDQRLFFETGHFPSRAFQLSCL